MTSERMRWREIVALSKEGDISALISGLSHRDITEHPFRRGMLIQQIVRMGGPDVVPVLIETLQCDKDPKVRQTAAVSLGPFGDNSAGPALRRALRDPDEKTRSLAAKSLGELRDRSSLDALAGSLLTGSKDVRWSAAIALGELGDQEATPSLILALDDPKSKVRTEAAASLAELADPRALGPMREAADRVPFWSRPMITRSLRNLEDRLGS